MNLGTDADGVDRPRRATVGSRSRELVGISYWMMSSHGPQRLRCESSLNRDCVSESVILDDDLSGGYWEVFVIEMVRVGGGAIGVRVAD